MRLTWPKEIAMERAAVYIVYQVKKMYTSLVFDVDDKANEQLLKIAPVLFQIKDLEILSSFDRVEVKLYRIIQISGKPRQVPIYGAVSIESYLHQGKLRPPVEAVVYTVLIKTKPYRIPAMVQYVKTRPCTLAVITKGVIGEEQVYEDRVHTARNPVVGSIIEAEVVDLEPGRLEFETVHQNNRLFYYLPKRSQNKKAGGHVLGLHRIWI